MKIQRYLTIVLCTIFILFFSFWCFFIATPDYSNAERRALAKMPEITWQSIKSGEFSKKFEEYTTDRFPARDMWRSVKAYTRLNVFMQKENNNIFVKDGHISKMEYPLNTDMLDYATSLFTKIHNHHFKHNNVYVSVIPDKNKYIADLKLDYDKLEKYVYKKMNFATHISVSQFLSADDYYFTDSHWKQENIVDVAQFIANNMGTSIPEKYEEKALSIPFWGVYAGQSALKCEPDVIKYLQNDVIKGLQVTGATAIYDESKAKGKDPYEFFVSGNQPLVEIKNPNSDNTKKLIVFRDSFASSLMPLLAQGYSEVVMIDLRYMNSALLGKLVDFSNADILFLYSANLLNNSTAMR